MATAAQTNVSGGLTISPGGQGDDDAERGESDGADRRRRRGSGAAHFSREPILSVSLPDAVAFPPFLTTESPTAGCRPSHTHVTDDH